ncbi:MAG: beta-lactamase family protein [Thermoanaerobaculia bacterium]|nr:beta-lactamase family protein [Thermoanaerobaculia bacterium]
MGTDTASREADIASASRLPSTPVALPASLPQTARVAENGIVAGLHHGAQIYVSRGASSGPPDFLDLSLGERAAGQVMTTDTLNLWLSSTKPVTAVAFALLWQAGEVDLDDAVARYVPEFAQKGKAAVTLRHVLTHTAGIRMLSVGWPEASWSEIIATVCRAKPEPRWSLGEKAGYHMASSWFLLGEVISRISGEPYPSFVRRRVLEPLGMGDSWIGMPQDRFRAYGDRIGRMWSTEAVAEGQSDSPLARNWHTERHVVGCSPGGNGYGPIRELGLFYEMLLRRGVAQDGQRLLTPQTVEALTTPHRVGLLDQTFRHKLDWGLGFIVDSKHYPAGDDDRNSRDLIPYGYGRHASRRTFGHSGFQSSTAFADPKHDLVVCIFTNGNPGEPRHTERFRDLTEAVYEDLGLGEAGVEAP